MYEPVGDTPQCLQRLLRFPVTSARRLAQREKKNSKTRESARLFFPFCFSLTSVHACRCIYCITMSPFSLSFSLMDSESEREIWALCWGAFVAGHCGCLHSMRSAQLQIFGPGFRSSRHFSLLRESRGAGRHRASLFVRICRR